MADDFKDSILSFSRIRLKIWLVMTLLWDLPLAVPTLYPAFRAALLTRRRPCIGVGLACYVSSAISGCRCVCVCTTRTFQPAQNDTTKTKRQPPKPTVTPESHTHMASPYPDNKKHTYRRRPTPRAKKRTSIRRVKSSHQIIS